MGSSKCKIFSGDPPVTSQPKGAHNPHFKNKFLAQKLASFLRTPCFRNCVSSSFVNRARVAARRPLFSHSTLPDTRSAGEDERGSVSTAFARVGNLRNRLTAYSCGGQDLHCLCKTGRLHKSLLQACVRVGGRSGRIPCYLGRF